MNLSEFKPTIIFLVKFIGIYLIGNLLYGFFVTAYEPAPDVVTFLVTEQCVSILNFIGWEVTSFENVLRPTVGIVYNQKAILDVYEGCNGINVIIIFLAFLIAFGPYKKSFIGFSLIGILTIHFFNLMRIILLFFVSISFPDYLYFTHKYLFTAFIYAIVLMLWIIWIRYFSTQNSNEV